MLVLWSASLYAKPETVVVDRISISGNDHTRPGVILRELLFQPGDSILVSDLSTRLEKSEESLLNTGLFNLAKIFFKNWEASSGKIHVQVEVTESWYIFPVPIFELADRNFNVWWVEQERDLNRIKIGIDFTHVNLTGRRDRLKFAVKYGYVRQYALKYIYPYLNRAKTLGMEGEISFQKRREINYFTEGNKQLFFGDRDKFIYQKFSSRLGLNYRPGHHIFHEFGLTFNHKEVDPRISEEQNPYFFINGTEERAFSASYAFTYDVRDFRAYPLSGLYFQAKITKPGLGIFKDKNLLLLALRTEQYFQVGEKWSLGYNVFAKTSLIRTRPPYENNHIMGSSSTTVPGYEYYILDGLDAGLLKTNFRYRLINQVLKFGKIMPLQAFKRIPLKVYLRLNNGWGYANDPFDGGQNPLNRTLLWGGGPAVDLIFFQNIVFRFEYSFNRLGEKGLFLHFKSNI